MGNAPAILIFKGKSDILDDLTEKESAELLRALFLYGDGKPLPKLTKTVSIIFKMIKSEIDDNEKRYNEKLEKNRKRVETSRQKAKAKENALYPSDKPPSEAKTSNTAKGNKTDIKPPTSENKSNLPVKQGSLTEKQARFLTEFEERYPNKAINCKLSDFPNVDLQALMYAIKQSPQFLEKKDYLHLQWMLEHSKEIIANKYINEPDDKKKRNNARAKPSTERNYTDEELNEALQYPEEIEL